MVCSFSAALTLLVTTVSGVRVTLPDAKRLVKLDFSKGKLAYLSDLTPSREAMTLATEDDDQYARFVRYRKDLNLDNQPLKLNGKPDLSPAELADLLVFLRSL